MRPPIFHASFMSRRWRPHAAGAAAGTPSVCRSVHYGVCSVFASPVFAPPVHSVPVYSMMSSSPDGTEIEVCRVVCRRSGKRRLSGADGSRKRSGVC